MIRQAPNVARRRTAMTVLACVTVLGLVPAAASDTGPPSGQGETGIGSGGPPPFVGDLPSGDHAVTLVTGDRIAVEVAPDGFVTATVDPID